MNDEATLIRGTIEDIGQSIEHLKLEALRISKELEAKETRLAAWNRRLQQIGGVSVPGTISLRRPRGANLSAITKALQASQTGLGAAEIQKTTGLPWSSVQGSLKRNPELFIEENGLWRLRPESMQIDLVAINGAAKH